MKEEITDFWRTWIKTPLLAMSVLQMHATSPLYKWTVQKSELCLLQSLGFLLFLVR